MPSILVVRDSDNFSRILKANGFKVCNVPLIETKELEDLSDFDKKLETLEIYDGIFLTGVKAAEVLAKKMREKNIDFRGKVYILGKRSFELLKTETLNLVFDEKANTAREMLENIPIETLENRRFLFISGSKSLRFIPEFLANTAAVDEVTIYETRRIAVETDKINSLREEFEKGEIRATCFFSPSGAESFIEQFGAKVLHQTYVATIGKTTTEFFERQAIKVDFVSPKSSAEDFAVGLIKFLEKETTA